MTKAQVRLFSSSSLSDVFLEEIWEVLKDILAPWINKKNKEFENVFQFICGLSNLGAAENYFT